ncbi:hypothetical protein [Pseudooctadecabacter jejudonensis]|uniref:Lipoprotein n=1 Tax=Pseudooctadecabacter jejudonensis TaxID=1391910 RepID=A0A1Y5R985_9RHOB|nr:hypothetical protein [Pseudooctadecabacter jejudonensis]SLN12118.1 hypothetical protein PSJ8397_00146 [Pseudooctadecabacter jejudonensis]
MTKLLPLLALPVLGGCAIAAALAGDGEPVGVLNGKTLYAASCTVDLSTAGQEGLFGTGTIPLYGNCQVAAANRCGEGAFTITNVEQAPPRMLSETVQTGTMIQRRTFPASATTLQFTCNG